MQEGNCQEMRVEGRQGLNFLIEIQLKYYKIYAFKLYN